METFFEVWGIDLSLDLLLIHPWKGIDMGEGAACMIDEGLLPQSECILEAFISRHQRNSIAFPD